MRYNAPATQQRTGVTMSAIDAGAGESAAERKSAKTSG